MDIETQIARAKELIAKREGSTSSSPSSSAASRPRRKPAAAKFATAKDTTPRPARRGRIRF